MRSAKPGQPDRCALAAWSRQRQEDRERPARSRRGRRRARRPCRRNAFVRDLRHRVLARPSTSTSRRRCTPARSGRRSTARPARRDAARHARTRTARRSSDRVAAVKMTVVSQPGCSNHASESTAIAMFPRALRSWPETEEEPAVAVDTLGAGGAVRCRRAAASECRHDEERPDRRGTRRAADEHEQRDEGGEGQQAAHRGSPARAPVDTGQGTTIGLQTGARGLNHPSVEPIERCVGRSA